MNDIQTDNPNSIAKRKGWVPLVLVFLGICAVWWLVRAPATSTSTITSEGIPLEQGSDVMEELLTRVDDSKAALQKDPLNTAALGELYALYDTVGKRAELTDYFDRAKARLEERLLSDGPASIPLAIETAQSLILGAEYEGALELLQAAYAVEPTNLPLLRALADVSFQAEYNEVSLTWLEEYVALASPEIEPDNYWGARMMRCAIILWQLEDAPSYEGSRAIIADLDEVLKAVPDNAEAWIYYGFANKQVGQYEIASEAFLKGAELTDIPDIRASLELEASQLEAQLKGSATTPDS